MQVEIWKDVAGYEGLYQVSSWGNIKSLDRKVVRFDGKIKTFKKVERSLGLKSYKTVGLSKEGKRKTHKVHRLVAIAFLKNKNGNIVNHIDFNPSNNRADNLEWCTGNENTDHSFRNGRYLDKNNKMRLSDDMQKLTMATLLSVGCASSISKKYGFNHAYISKIINGKQNKEFKDIFNCAINLKESNFAEYRQ